MVGLYLKEPSRYPPSTTKYAYTNTSSRVETHFIYIMIANLVDQLITITHRINSER